MVAQKAETSVEMTVVAMAALKAGSKADSKVVLRVDETDEYLVANLVVMRDPDWVDLLAVATVAARDRMKVVD